MTTPLNKGKVKLRIKFSHNYYKFPMKLPFTAKLLQALVVHYDSLSGVFLDYDTEYYGNKFGDQYYQLPKTSLILLILKLEGNGLFTTIRRYTPQKWKYYKSHEGDEFEIVKT